MRVQNISSNYYAKVQTFCSKNDKKEQNRYSSVANYTLPIAIAAMSVLASATGCDKGDILDIDKSKYKKDSLEVVDSIKDEKPPIDIVVDTTYNEIYEDIILFDI